LKGFTGPGQGAQEYGAEVKNSGWWEVSMRKLLRRLIVFLLFVFLFQFQSLALSPRETILQILKEHSPTGYYIVDQYEKAPEEVEFKDWKQKIYKHDFMEYVRGETIENLLLAINTVVHETCHSYTLVKTYQLSKDNNGKTVPGYDAYYVGNDINILVKKTTTFNTVEIAASIPESLRTFRFKTYVSGESKNVRSKSDGVYGLLDEYNAYYHGNKAAFDLYPYYRDKMNEGPEKWHKYFAGINGSFSANMEFKFFIIRYLQYAKTNYPKIYRGIIQNKDFIAAFRAIEKNHEELVRDYFRVKEEIYEILRKEGDTVWEDEKYYYIEQGHSRTGASHNLEDFYLLQKELENEEYQPILAELRTVL
jgi:hypothetical protein